MNEPHKCIRCKTATVSAVVPICFACHGQLSELGADKSFLSNLPPDERLTIYLPIAESIAQALVGVPA